MVKIFIDPGHGGTDPGAVSNGLQEKDLTLKIAKKIRDKLADYKGVQVKMSRTSDKTLSLKQRTDMANSWGADYVISVHINAGGGTGFESFTYNGSYKNKSETNRKRSILHDEIMRQLGDVRDRGKKEGNLHMVRETRAQSVLTENLFIDNAGDAKLLKQDAWLDRIAQGHVNGIVKIFGLTKETKKPSATTGDTYVVKAGDTLWSISRKFGMTVAELKSLNGLKSDLIHPGDKLTVKASASSPQIRVGQKVKVKQNAKKYATGQSIPSWVKGKTYTVQQVKSDRVLLKEIYSWVFKEDVE
jgi:N-acetylmuramoyl-L-alanine amidase